MDTIGHPRIGDNNGRDEIELFLRDAFAEGCSAHASGSITTAADYARRTAPKLRAALAASATPQGATAAPAEGRE